MLKRWNLGRWIGLSLAGFAAHWLGPSAQLIESAGDFDLDLDCFEQTRLVAHPGVDLGLLNRLACRGRCSLLADEKTDAQVVRATNCFGDSAEFRLSDEQALDQLRRFVRPPKLIDAQRFGVFEQTVRKLQPDETVLFIYLPDPTDAADLKKQYLHPTQLFPTAEASFRRFATACDSSVQCFVVKDEQVGRQLGLSASSYGDVFAVSKEDLLKGRFANDNRFDQRLVYSKVATYVDLHHEAPAALLQRISPRIFALASALDLDGYLAQRPDRDRLVLHAQDSQQTQELIRSLDKHLDRRVDIVFTQSAQLLEQGLGIVPDNYIATCRFVRSSPQAESQVRHLQLVEGKWADVTRKARSRPQHFRLAPDLDDILFVLANLGRTAPCLESSSLPLRHSRPIDASVLAALAKADRFSLVKFHRKDCPACERIHDLYERLAQTLSDSQRLDQLHLHHREKLRDVQACSFDLALDTDEDFEVHKTPMILVLGRNKVKPVDLFSEKLDLSDIDRVVYKLIRVVDEM